MFKISDKLYFSFSNYTNFKCTYFLANETTFAILGIHLWPLSVYYGLLPHGIRSDRSEQHGLQVIEQPYTKMELGMWGAVPSFNNQNIDI